MSWAYFAAGIVVAIAVIVVGLGMSDVASIDGEAVCEERFGQNWTVKNTTYGNDTSVMLACTNGTTTQTTGVEIEVQT